MKKQLILVKHSQPEIVEGLPANQWKLSKEGQKLAHRLAERLTCYQPDAIVSSIEPKAKETAEIIARKHQLELHLMAGLHEHDRSNEPYLANDRFQASIQEFFEKPDVLVFGRESASQAHRRFYRCVYSVLNTFSNKTVVVVAHGTVISLFVSRLIGIPGLLLWHELGLPSFVVIDLQSNELIARENIN